MKKTLGFILFIVSIAVQAYDAQRVMVITNHRYGFFSIFFGVLSSLDYCERNNLIPVVHWPKQNCHFYQEGGYNGSTEPWEY